MLETPVRSSPKGRLSGIVQRVRAWIRRLADAVRAVIASAAAHPRFTAALLWVLAIAGNLLIFPNVGMVLLIGAVVIGAIRSGFNPITTVTVFVIAIFVIPARYAFLGMSLSMMLGLGALGLWVFHRMANGPVPTRRHQRVNTWIGIFLAAKVISYANAQLHFRPAEQVQAADRQLLVFLAFAGIAFYVNEVARESRHLHRLVNLLIAGAGFMALTAITEQYTGLDVSSWLRPPGFSLGGRSDGGGALLAPERFGVRRAFGSATGPLEYTTMILAGLPLAVHRAVYGRTVNEKRLGTAMSFLIVLGLPMSLSRTAVVGLLLAIVLISAGLKVPERRKLLAGFGITALFVLTTFSAVGGAFIQLTTSFFAGGEAANVGTAGRTEDYEIVGSLVGDRPVLGLGLAVHDPTEPRLVNGRRVRNLFLDNQYLSEAVSGGVVGLLALLSVQLAGINAAIRARKLARTEADTNLSYSVAASLMIMMLTFAFFDALAFRSTAGLFFVLLALAGALEATIESEDDSAPLPAGPRMGRHQPRLHYSTALRGDR